MIKRFLASGRSGFYFSVVEAGRVSVGSTIQLVSRDANHVSIADVQRFYLGPARDPELLRRIEKLVALPESWKRELSLRAQTNRSLTSCRLLLHLHGKQGCTQHSALSMLLHERHQTPSAYVRQRCNVAGARWL
jgi:hypothetical protein